MSGPKFKEGDSVRNAPSPTAIIKSVEWSPPQGTFIYRIEGEGWHAENVPESALEVPRREPRIIPIKYLRKVRGRIERAKENYDPVAMRAARKNVPPIEERKKLAEELDLLFKDFERIVDDLIGFPEERDH